jgi:AcrR family transcriptional regulator
MGQQSLRSATKPSGRTRLSVDARREQLISAGLETFSRKPYDEISMEEVARGLGISKGLLYHYFPSKRDFYIEVTRVVIEELGEVTAPDPSLPPLERLRAGLDAWLDYVETRAEGWKAAVCGGIGTDEQVRRIVDDSRASQAVRVIHEIQGPGRQSAVLEAAVRGWIGFNEAVVLRWLDRRDVSREQLRDLMAYVLIDAIQSARRVDPTIEPLEPRPEPPGN